jgi:hypothetical protein
MSWIEEDVLPMSQVFAPVNTSISSDEADDSEDNSGKSLTACKDYTDKYWKSYFSGDEGKYVLLKTVHIYIYI